MLVKFDKGLMDELGEEAKNSPRLRMNRDMRNSPEDGSQRMLNALEPGTKLPVHRHVDTSESVVILRGRAVQHFYDDQGRLLDSVEIAPGSDCVGMNVPAGAWHRLESLEPGTVIFEAKDGPYQTASIYSTL